jgi:hypothetical protein
MGIERMFMKKIKNQQVFGEMVNYFYLKYLSPIILIGLIVLLYFLALYVSSISALMPFFCWGLILLCLFLFLLSILIPKNIIIYDEYNRVLIIRGGKTAFSYLRKRKLRNKSYYNNANQTGKNHAFCRFARIQAEN